MADSIERVLATYGAAIARLAASYERVPSRREELVQEIALALWRAWPSFRGECSERSFVYRIAHNRGLSHALARAPAAATLEELTEAEQPIDPRPRPEEAVAQAEQHRRLHAAIWTLPLAQRQVALLLLEGLSLVEIAAVLGISENNAAVRANRARAELRAALEAAEAPLPKRARHER